MSVLKSPKDTNFYKPSLNARGRLLQMDQPLVMGILNLTPDSFYDGGLHLQPEKALEKVEQMLEDGADIIDIGATSTRPGARLSEPREEIRALEPVLNLITQSFPDALLSIDTYHSDVARAAAGLGAHIINDISGGTFDTQMAQTLGEIKLPVILMHTPATPDKMQDNPHYADVVMEVAKFLSIQMNLFLDAGVNDIILDPGFGFGKTTEHNFEILNSLRTFKAMGRPVLVGASRKSMINKVLGISSKEALNGTTVINTMALMKGADILRVHDVKQAVQAIKLTSFARSVAGRES